MLTEYQDVFSKGPDDMGCTDLVKHQIDTGDARPIRQPPRHLPIAKQAVEQVEVSKHTLLRGLQATQQGDA